MPHLQGQSDTCPFCRTDRCPLLPHAAGFYPWWCPEHIPSQAAQVPHHVSATGSGYKKPGPQAASLHIFTGLTQSCSVGSVTNRAGEPPQAMFQIHCPQQQPFNTPQSACNKFRDLRIKRFLVLVFLSHGTVKANIRFKNPKLLSHKILTKPITMDYRR